MFANAAWPGLACLEAARLLYMQYASKGISKDISNNRSVSFAPRHETSVSRSALRLMAVA